MVNLTNALALDCEMVGAGDNGSYEMVAKVSIVNEYEECVFDTHISPRYEVTDYRTWISGIEAYHLNEAPPLDEVKRDVANMIRGRILVGHCMEKDLRLLGLCHPEWRKRDTSVYFRTNSNTPPSLKFLAREYLGRDIQNGAHSSVVDANATMALYKLYEEEWESNYNDSDSDSEYDSD